MKKPKDSLAQRSGGDFSLAQRSVESPPLSRGPESGSSETRSKLTAHFVSSSLERGIGVAGEVVHVLRGRGTGEGYRTMYCSTCTCSKGTKSQTRWAR